MRRASAALALLVSLACREPAADATAPPLVNSAGALDPAPYRESISGLEALLYRDEPLVAEDWRRVSALLLELHNAIVYRDGGAGAREASARLFYLSARVDAYASLKDGKVDLEELRSLWEDARSKYFEPADWLHALRVPPPPE